MAYITVQERQIIYQVPQLESRIVQFYQSKKVFTPSELSLRLFNSELNILVTHSAGPARSAKIYDTYEIWIDPDYPLEERRVEIAHEIGHFLLHSGQQLWMPDDWRLKQECQANRFSMYALMPYDLIFGALEHAPDSEYALISYMSDLFRVPTWFVKNRFADLEEYVVKL